MLGIKQATVIRMKGTEVLNTKEYDKETFDVSEHLQEEEKSPVDSINKFLKI